ncbi:MAG: response regulator transcription factor [Candidatus Pacebacteria bacterium]|nr:response regulator transcription factor [Candidatus Paceibacterota bacterium]
MRILIIEDNLEIIDSLKTSLEEECFAVDIANDGEKGSYLARTNDYDLILLDIMLPNKTGDIVCKEIREAGKDTPILILSIKPEIEDKVNLLNLGADDYLTKPFLLIELLARIKALLRRPKNIENNIILLNDFVIDMDKYLVVYRNKKIDLTKKEFMLLEYLARNKGKVLSRGMIMEHVWDLSIDPFSNTIEAHIMNLRKKIYNTSKRKLIKTVSGRGYKIDEF